jgi:hypothetical protein
MLVRALKDCATTSHTLKEGVEYEIRSADAKVWIEKGLIEAVPVKATKSTKSAKSEED